MIRRFTNSRFFLAHPALFFWLSYGLLNLLLFVPLFLLDGGDNTLLPHLAANGGLWSQFSNFAVWRSNLDPQRINVEFALLVALWVAVPLVRRTPYRILTIVLYLLALIYAIYEAIVLSIWLIDPVFYSQWFLARDGIPFLLNNLGAAWWVYAVVVLALMVAGWLLTFLFRTLFASGAQPNLRWVSRAAIVALACFAVITTISYQSWTSRPEMVMSSSTVKIARNIGDSLALYHAVQTFDDSAMRVAYDYSGLQLERKPDIFLIFVESYGSVLYKRGDWAIAYPQLLADVEGKLEDAGWHTASTLSESPTWGGGSWLAYTSALMGMTIDNQPQYLDLRKRYDDTPYPNLGRALQEEGYDFTYLSALDDDYTDAQWTSLDGFYGADRIIRYEDLDYAGGGFGWGDSPPDQYTLNDTIEMIRAAADKPHFLMTITQNSHYPFAPQPPLVADWHTLVNQKSDTQAREAALAAEPIVRRTNYFSAVYYQLHMLADLITTQGDENSLFILVGDHQPPTVSRRADGFQTPIHIVSRNQKWVDAFSEFGFEPGLLVSDAKATAVDADLDHAAIYSMIMRFLAEGEDGSAQGSVPVWHPAGVIAMP